MSHLSKSEKRWIISAYSLIIYLVVSNKFTYKITNFLLTKISDKLSTCDANGNPTPYGYGLHMVVFFLLVRAIMELPGVIEEKDY